MCLGLFQEIPISLAPFQPFIYPTKFCKLLFPTTCFQVITPENSFQNLQTVHKDYNFTNFPGFRQFFLLYLELLFRITVLHVLVTDTYLQLFKLLFGQLFCKLSVLELGVQDQVFKVSFQTTFLQIFVRSTSLQIVRPGTSRSGPKSWSRHPFCKVCKLT